MPLPHAETEHRLKAVKEIVRHAGLKLRRRLLAGRRRMNAVKKAGGEWVTDLDRVAEEYIISSLQKHYPNDGFLGEESGLQGNAARCWAIDPIDGTTNFIHGFLQCAVSVAYCVNGRAEIGVIYDIAADEMYSATTGGGAYLEDKRLRVSGETLFAHSLFILGGRINEDLMPLLVSMAKRCDGMRRLGATTLDLAWVASGKADAVVSGPVRFWDVAAGALLLREAGGLLSDLEDNTEFAFNEKTKSFVAATPRVFSAFFSEVKDYHRRQSP